jgi:hypothetical protein
MVKKKRRKKGKRYFFKINQTAILAYNKCDDPVLRNRIYNRFIQYPFNKLAENLIHTYKTYYFDIPYEDVKANVVAFLIQKIHLYNPIAGRAYSYFTVVGRNYLFNENNANYARFKSKDDVSAIDSSRDVVGEVSNSEHRESQSDFMDYYTRYIDFNLYTLFKKERDVMIADSVNELFKKRVDLYSYNKKALYILIRERTNVDTQYITRVINQLKRVYGELLDEYNTTGYLNMDYKLDTVNG